MIKINKKHVQKILVETEEAEEVRRDPKGNKGHK